MSAVFRRVVGRCFETDERMLVVLDEAWLSVFRLGRVFTNNPIHQKPTPCKDQLTQNFRKGQMLCLAAFFLETNDSETEGLVIRYRIEYSFEKHLAFDAKENVVMRNNILTAKNRDAFTNLPILHGKEPNF